MQPRLPSDVAALLPQLPLVLNSFPYQWIASTDPKNRNQDYILLKPGETRRVPLPSGRLLRLWSTASEPDKLVLRIETERGARIPLFGAPGDKPLIDKTFLEYGGVPWPTQSKGGRRVRYDSPAVGAELIATNLSKQPNKWFYQATVRSVPIEQYFKPRSLVLSRIGAPKIVDAKQLLKTGQSLGAVDIAGPFKFGFVEELKITLAPATVETWNRVILRGWATQRPKPLGSITEQNKAPQEFNPRFAISTPLLPLSGQFLGLGAKRDAVSDFDGKTLTLRWPLPFDRNRDAPTLDVVNLSSGRVTVTLQARVRELRNPPPTIFHAHFGSSQTRRGVPLSIASVQGEGAFVGLAMAMRPVPTSPRRAFAYLEGNETIRADGNTFEGTGTEDFFNSAWYFPEQPFARPFGGATFRQPLPPQVAAYRWMVPDPVPFKRELKFDFEHGSSNNSDDLEYRWLACFYASPQATWSVPDDLTGNPEAGGDPRREAGREAKVRSYILGTLGAIIGLAVVVALFGLLRRAPKP